MYFTINDIKALTVQFPLFTILFIIQSDGQSIQHFQNTYRVSQKKVGSQKISNCSNSLNFEAKINCNTIKPNVPKWRKTCTGLKFDLLNFYGPQSNIHTF